MAGVLQSPALDRRKVPQRQTKKGCARDSTGEDSSLSRSERESCAGPAPLFGLSPRRSKPNITYPLGGDSVRTHARRKRALADSGDVVTVSVDDAKPIWVRHSREGFRVAAIDHGVVAVTKRATLRVPARVRLEMDLPRWVDDPLDWD